MMMIETHSMAVTAAQGIGLGLLRRCSFSIADQISAMIQPYDAVAPPPVKPNSYRIRRRNLLQRKRRTKRKLSGDDYGNEGFFFGDGSAGDGGGGFGGSGGGGGGWNDNRFGDESSYPLPDPAFDFVYQVLSWIMLLNCLHFALKKIIRIVVDSHREKLPTKLATIC
ncbi:hypothetical protein Lal_00050092 [Lupinus albus]|uniref:Uncharacterized protein n=1 Tax=Lupinus albus TaxID=3870 RepID=A0A6A4PM02_LUPAL|nr:hypothetical protein Lalb_Chr12g0201151 [Lupinus albus]KAF1867659.1 hypothetical protein Lal_00050092 [Lupinus albus]